MRNFKKMYGRNIIQLMILMSLLRMEFESLVLVRSSSGTSGFLESINGETRYEIPHPSTSDLMTHPKSIEYTFWTDIISDLNSLGRYARENNPVEISAYVLNTNVRSNDSGISDTETETFSSTTNLLLEAEDVQNELLHINNQLIQIEENLDNLSQHFSSLDEQLAEQLTNIKEEEEEDDEKENNNVKENNNNDTALSPFDSWQCDLNRNLEEILLEDELLSEAVGGGNIFDQVDSRRPSKTHHSPSSNCTSLRQSHDLTESTFSSAGSSLNSSPATPESRSRNNSDLQIQSDLWQQSHEKHLISLANHDIFRSNTEAPEIVRHNVSAFGGGGSGGEGVRSNGELSDLCSLHSTRPISLSKYSSSSSSSTTSSSSSSSSSKPLNDGVPSSSNTSKVTEDYFSEGSLNSMLRTLTNEFNSTLAREETKSGGGGAAAESLYLQSSINSLLDSRSARYVETSSQRAFDVCSSPSSDFSTDYYSNDSHIGELISPFNVSSYSGLHSSYSSSSAPTHSHHFNHTYATFIPPSVNSKFNGIFKQEIKREDSSISPYGTQSRLGAPLKKEESSEEIRASNYRSRHSRDEKRARELGIPFSMDDVITLPMDEFNDLLSRHDLSEEQLNLCRDIRRRGKNKVAAQNCRKRKIDQICELQENIENTQKRKNKLMEERRELEENRAYWLQQVFNIEQQILEHENKNPKLYALEIAHDHEVRIVHRYPMGPPLEHSSDPELNSSSRYGASLLAQHLP